MLEYPVDKHGRLMLRKNMIGKVTRRLKKKHFDCDDTDYDHRQATTIMCDIET